MAKRWIVSPLAVAEDFGDEIVCMAVDIGVFYSLRGSAAELWRACAAGVSVDRIETALQAHPPLRELLDSLQTDEVLTQGEDGLDQEVTFSGAADFTRNAQFDDLIRLDPIHDVDERGWPFT